VSRFKGFLDDQDAMAARNRCERMYVATLGGQRYVFDHLATLMAQATPARSGDQLARLSAPTEEVRVAARRVLADCPCARSSKT
jgi:ethanolamine ammonia-lyase large subunit